LYCVRCDGDDRYCRAKKAVIEDKKYSLKGRQVDVFNDTLDKANANEQVLMLIHGKWGTGKTRTTNAILDGLKRIGIYSKCTGSTGVAATNYTGGMTSHSLFGLNASTPTFIERLTEHMKKIVNRLGKATFIVCDEVSMYQTKLVVQMNTILQTILGNNKPFGGISMIFVGDFYQKTLPGSTPLNHALYYHGMETARKRQDQAAAILFEKFQKFELDSGPHCRQKCKVLTSILDALRTEEYPITPTLLSKLPPLTEEDLEDPAYLFAKTVVMGNKERNMINEPLAKLWAREHDVPLLCWDTQLRDSSGVLTDPEERKEVADNVPGLRRYFATGIPAIISKNIDVENEQVNGTLCKMVSLSWLPEIKHDVIDKLRKGTLRPSANGEAHRVPPPYSINVETTNRAGVKTTIPIVARSTTTGQHDSTGFKTSDGRHLSVKHHYVDLGFCFTDYKVQGITVKKGDKLILVLDDLPARLDVATISVCLSRVTRIEDLRIFKLDGTIKHLVRLHKDYVTGLWELGYETWNSRWDADKLKCVRQAGLMKLMKEFAKFELGKLKMAGKDGLDAWLTVSSDIIHTNGTSDVENLFHVT
jgi:hypothetical protein